MINVPVFFNSSIQYSSFHTWPIVLRTPNIPSRTEYWSTLAIDLWLLYLLAMGYMLVKKKSNDCFTKILQYHLAIHKM